MLIDSDIFIQKLEKESQETTTNAHYSKIETESFCFLEILLGLLNVAPELERNLTYG